MLHYGYKNIAFTGKYDVLSTYSNIDGGKVLDLLKTRLPGQYC